MKLSIVIPAYNAEKTISRCLDSVLAQNYFDYEVIVVNDGSTDNTDKICAKYIENDEKVRLISQKNKGVSAARNTGISEANGEYILFIDADDYIENNTFGFLLGGIEDKHDGALFGYNLLGIGNWGSDIDVLRRMIEKNGNDISASNILEHVLTINPDEELLGYSVRYLYKREIIKRNSIKFDTSLRISEDYKFIVEYLRHSKLIYVLDKKLYNYDVNEFSSTSKYIPSLNDDMNSVNEWIKMNVYYNENIIREHQGCIANAYLNHVQNIAKKDSGHSLVEGIMNIYSIKRKFNYSDSIKFTVKKLKTRRKARFAFVLFHFNLDFIYYILFFIRRRL